jgi:hypothetical protein
MAEGQFTGARQNYIYENDAAEEYIITTDETLGSLAGTGLVVATTANVTGASPAPKRFTPRGVYWQGETDDRIVRKRIICGTGEAALYAADTSQALTVDGVAGFTTGRVGEKITFLKLSAGGDDGGGAPAA